MIAEVDEIGAVFGGDPWPYGVEPNRPDARSAGALSGGAGHRRQGAERRRTVRAGAIARGHSVDETRKLHRGWKGMLRRGRRRRRRDAARPREPARCARGGRARRNATGRGANAKPDHKLSDIAFLPVIPTRARFSAPASTIAHAAEVGRELPRQPSMFIRFADTLVGHEGAMIRPHASEHFDFEGELAMVIGRAAVTSRWRALDHVAGYTCFVDGSVRDYQKFSVTSGKNWPGTGPLGPWMVTGRRNSRSRQADADHAAQRPAGAALRHRQADLFMPSRSSASARTSPNCIRAM
jgi:2-keto-4-pentenoate hydratase/2-oxohepta-3-ene-1,7-dioic acid hydratase in catechol pathway